VTSRRTNPPLALSEDRLFPAEPTVRAVARRLYAAIADLPIVSPHGHTDPRWFASNENFADPVELLVAPDHYLYRMLYSQGIALEALGIRSGDEKGAAADSRGAWRTFATHYHLFRGTPSRLWLDYVFVKIFDLDVRLTSATADLYFDRILERLARADYRPRELFDRFRIEVLATTESPLDDLRHHRQIRDSGWPGRVITTFRPDPVVDPEYEGFANNLRSLGETYAEDTTTWAGYLNALRHGRRLFATHGATATDHGHASAATADLDARAAAKLFERVARGEADAADSELFRAQMLTEMAKMSLEDGLVMQIHPGSFRNHNRDLFRRYGRNRGADIPTATDYVHALKPLLDRFGNERALTIIVFTLDETSYSRELAPLAGHYPALKLGPPWWFHDSPEGMRRFREQATETAGFYNTVGFNDDTRAFLSIPARHDVARRMDCAHLARLVAEHQLEEDEAHELANELAYGLVKRAYKLA
jgi:glucuronate isomerase